MRANEIIKEEEEEVEMVQMSKYHDGPRYWYHSLRGRELNAEGGIDSYPFPPGETVLAHEFRDWEEGDTVVYLAQTPLSDDALKIDITKLDTVRNMRYTWQAEGYAIHRGTIPREAIVDNINERKEIEFVCVNDSFADTTTQANQDALFNALREVPDVLVYKQDFGEHNLMAAIVFDTTDIRKIKQLSQKYNVKIDLISDVPDQFINSIYNNRLEGLTDWYAS